MSPRLRLFPILATTAFVAALLIHAPSCALNTYGTEPPGGSTACTVDANCDDANPCTDDKCGGNNVCQHTPRPEGEILAPGLQTPGDCRTKLCKSGEPVEQNDDQDKLASTDSCTVNGCNAGEPTVTVQPDGAACTQSSATGICGMGKCVVECGPSKPCNDKNPCTEDACDGTTHTCNFSPLDGLPTPGFTPKAGDCMQQLCVKGIDTPIVDDTDVPDDKNPCTLDVCTNGTPSNPDVPSGELCMNGQPDVCDGSGNCVECVDPTDCVNLPADDECQTRTCVANKCGQTFAAMGTPASVQMAGDCKKVVCDGAGKKVSTNDDTDIPNDNNACTSDTCNNGKPSNTNLAANTSCGASLYCDGSGNCVGCTMPSQCAGTDDFCKTRTCVNGQCGVSYTAAGTALPMGQTAKDCKVIACDGAGNATTIPDNSDLPVDGEQCTKDVCTMGTPSNPPQATGFTCSENGGTVCNGAGVCKRANGQMCDAASPTDCLSQNCIDGYCCNSTCGSTCQACNVAGSLGNCTNVPKGTDDGVCAGSSVSCDGSGNCKSEPGQTCSTGGTCLSSNCVDGVCCTSGSCSTCQACNLSGNGTCANIPAGQQDNFPANACVSPNVCNGSGSCKKQNGQNCGQGSDCSSGNCVDGVCCSANACGTCQTCNGGMPGTCTQVTAGQTDDTCAAPKACDASGMCKKQNGQGCTMGSDCVSGNCVDMVCCGAASCGTCQTCNGGSPGTCTNVPNGQSDDTCMSPSVCNGGTCNVKKTNGQTCSTGSDCVSGNCVDGVCCGSTSCGTCETCNGGTPGTCTKVSAGSTDDTCTSPSKCDAAGDCQKVNGLPCSTTTDCQSGYCVDGYCCNGACNSTCQTCSASPGSCMPVAMGGTDDAPVCNGNNVCDGAGSCKLANGQSCNMDSDCASGSCTGGPKTCQ